MFLRNISRAIYNCSGRASYVTKVPKPEVPKNPLEKVYSASQQKDNGIIYDKKPFKITLEAGKTYHWCLCGRSKRQPLCDGTHKDIFLKVTQRYVTTIIYIGLYLPQFEWLQNCLSLGLYVDNWCPT